MAQIPDPPRARLRLSELANLAGLLTLSRLPLAIVFPFFAHDPRQALGLYLLAQATDVADGYVARLTHTTSHTGSVLDGWLDKVFHINAAWALVNFDWIPAWWMLLWFARELVQAPMVFWLTPRFVRGQVRPYEAVWAGKICTVSIAAAIIAALTGHRELGLWPTLLAGTTGSLAALQYLSREIGDQRRSRSA